jgi:hypothetical protein
MSRPTFNDLVRTRAAGYWPSRAGAGKHGERFETKADCKAEDQLRSRSARKVAVQTSDDCERSQLLRLAARLAYDQHGKRHPKSLASSVYMRSKRQAVGSQIWRLVQSYQSPVTTATVIKRSWELTPEQLEKVDVSKLRKGFVADLDRCGAVGAKGWLIGFVHGEWETPTNVFRLHLHLIVAGGMIKVVDRLRKRRNYKRVKGDGVQHRVRIGRETLNHLPFPITYCCKSYWPWKHVILTEHGKRRTRDHKRIREPYHSQVLLFLDRHSLSDLVVLKHVSVKGGRLVFNRNQQGR